MPKVKSIKSFSLNSDCPKASNLTSSWGRKKRKATKASEEANHIRKSRHRMLLLNTLLLCSWHLPYPAFKEVLEDDFKLIDIDVFTFSIGIGGRGSTDRHPEREVLFLERLKGEDPKDMMIGSSFMNTSLWVLIIVLLASARESSKSGSCSLLLIGVSAGAAVDSSIIGFSVLEMVKRGLGLGTMVPSGASSSEGLVNQGPLLPATEGDLVWNPSSPDSTATSMIGPEKVEALLDLANPDKSIIYLDEILTNLNKTVNVPDWKLEKNLLSYRIGSFLENEIKSRGFPNEERMSKNEEMNPRPQRKGGVRCSLLSININRMRPPAMGEGRVGSGLLSLDFLGCEDNINHQGLNQALNQYIDDQK
ncbi:hypothetical protein FNV43_RR08271 [Rhamnella rubrinervis]|uniref:Uncharacterized protein n=1 Tax=Rhamnella rubrinervis TaxID=2594499 RepID=A0A8K0HI99_9ROSA|nr:hypothetical protein FNV43_RR08271 [Rhamnella rubrinervis]